MLITTGSEPGRPRMAAVSDSIAGSSCSRSTSPAKPIEIVPWPRGGTSPSEAAARTGTASLGAGGSSPGSTGRIGMAADEPLTDRAIDASTDPAPRGRMIGGVQVPGSAAGSGAAACPLPFPFPDHEEGRARTRDRRSRSALKAVGPIRTASSQACTVSHSSCAASSRRSTRPVISTTASSAQALAVSAKTLGKTTTSTLPWRSSTVATSMVEPARVMTRRVDWMMPPRVTLAWSLSSARSPV